ncbi:MAG: hypothetical protein VXU48_03040 [Verrucomicrobiota bacterium]|nr:hypothetical protein [Verrucomicrobiota bacterium]
MLYKTMSIREKFLCLCFILVLLFIWSNNWLNRTYEWNMLRNLSATELATQQEWLERNNSISVGLNNALKFVDPSKTYAASQLSGKIDSLIRQTGLSNQADIDSVRTREGEIFNDHNLRVRLSRISIAQLIVLNKLLIQETPYINLQSVRIQKNRSNPEQLDVRYQINSFDLIDTN